MVPGLPPSAPKDHSFYRKSIIRFYRRRSEFKVTQQEKSYEEFTESEVAKSLAAQFALDPEQIEDLGKTLEKAASDHDMPEVSGLGAFIFQVMEIELGWAFQNWMAMHQIRKMLEAKGAKDETAKDFAKPESGVAA